MPEDIPKTVVILVWLLSGIIIFGWLLMEYTLMASLIFSVIFFGIPTLVYNIINKKTA